MRKVIPRQIGELDREFTPRQIKNLHLSLHTPYTYRTELITMEKAIKDLRETGFGVIEDYISAERCDAVMQEMKRLVEDAKQKLDEQAKTANSKKSVFK